MKYISTDRAPTPAGHYSQAILHKDYVFVSGQLAIDPATGEKKLGSITEQTKQVLSNMQEILLAAGSDKSKVLKVTIFVSDISKWDEVNRVYAAFFGGHRPARAVVPTGDLHHGFQVELEAIATTASFI